MWAPSILNLSTGWGLSGWLHTSTCHFISEEGAPVSHWVGGWVGHWENIEIFLSLQRKTGEETPR
jgi:hypothetical protein